LIFHLGGAVRNRTARTDASSRKILLVARLLSLFRKLGRAFVPTKLWRRFNRIHAVQSWADAHWARPLRGDVFLETRNALLTDPEGFLRRLQNLPQDQAEVSRDPKS
jgi:hypothetical protein